jgi:hypothetical protein
VRGVIRGPQRISIGYSGQTHVKKSWSMAGTKVLLTFRVKEKRLKVGPPDGNGDDVDVNDVTETAWAPRVPNDKKVLKG